MANVGGAQPFMRPRQTQRRPIQVRPPRLQRPRPPRPNGGAQPVVAPAPVQAQAPAAPKPPPSPLDSQYWQDVNRQQFDAGQQINALNQQSGYARTDLGETMRQLGLRQPVLKQNATNTANSQGLLYSGALGSQIGDLETDYLRERSQAQQGYDREEAGRQSQISGIQGGLNFDRLAAEMTAIERQTQRAADAPLVGGPPPRAVKNGPGRPRVPKAKPKPSPRVQPARRKR